MKTANEDFNDLVRLVGRLFPRAARLLMEESFQDFKGSGCIWGLFVWNESIQGVDYWLEIADRIDPDMEGC